MADPAQAQSAATPAGAAVELGEFDALLKKEFRPKTDGVAEQIKNAVQTLAQQALAGTALISDDVVRSIEAIIAQLDAKLSEQVNEIIHHEAFRSLEGTWRGLHHFG